MKHKLVSKSGQMESFVVWEGMLDEGHRCGACHNVSDAKVRMMTKQDKESECALKVSVYVCTFHWLYEGFIPAALGASRCGC